MATKRRRNMPAGTKGQIDRTIEKIQDAVGSVSSTLGGKPRQDGGQAVPPAPAQTPVITSNPPLVAALPLSGNGTQGSSVGGSSAGNSSSRTAPSTTGTAGTAAANRGNTARAAAMAKGFSAAVVPPTAPAAPKDAVEGIRS